MLTDGPLQLKLACGGVFQQVPIKVDEDEARFKTANGDTGDWQLALSKAMVSSEFL